MAGKNNKKITHNPVNPQPLIDLKLSKADSDIPPQMIENRAGVKELKNLAEHVSLPPIALCPFVMDMPVIRKEEAGSCKSAGLLKHLEGLGVEQLEAVYREAVKEKALNSLYFFNKEVLGYGGMVEGLHTRLCEFVVNSRAEVKGEGIILAPLDTTPRNSSAIQVERGRVSRQIKKLILMPRGSFKSSVVTIGYSLWRLIKDPNIRILIDSETQQNSKNFLHEIKEHMVKNEVLREIFPLMDSADEDLWTKTEVIVKNRTRPHKEPSITATGVDITKTGMHYDLIIADDIVSQNNITTIEQRDKVIAHYKLLLALLEPGGELLFVGTRWHDDDVYGYILDNEPNFERLIMKAVNKDGSLLFPERLTQEFLDDQRRAMGSYLFSCNPGYCPILMADWTFKQISEVKVGDEVVGFTIGDKNHNSKLVKTKVTEINSRKAMTQHVEMESGRELFCTPDHNWYTGRTGQDGSHKPYMPTKIGRPLQFVIDPYKLNCECQHDTSKEAFWLGGIFDGEGSCCKRVITLTQSKTSNPEVFNEIERCLKLFDFKYGVAHRQSGVGNGAHSFWINGGLAEKRRFALLTQPIKKDKIFNSLFGSKFSQEDMVVKITPHREETVYALTTETGNYVAWGYCSKNCQYQNEPVDEDSQIFRRSWIKHYFPQEIDTSKMSRYIAIDPAMSEKGDYSAIVCVGQDKSNNLYVLDYVREKMLPNRLIDEVFRMQQKWMPIKVGIEVFAFQKALQYEIRDRMRKVGKFFLLESFSSDTRVGKETRIKGLQPRFENGTVFIRHDMNELEDELLRFPMSGNDDIVDALAYTLQMIDTPYDYEEERKDLLEREMYYAPAGKCGY